MKNAMKEYSKTNNSNCFFSLQCLKNGTPTEYITYWKLFTSSQSTYQTVEQTVCTNFTSTWMQNTFSAVLCWIRDNWRTTLENVIK